MPWLLMASGGAWLAFAGPSGNGELGGLRRGPMAVDAVFDDWHAGSRFALTRFALTRFALTRFALTRFALTRFALTRRNRRSMLMVPSSASSNRGL